MVVRDGGHRVVVRGEHRHSRHRGDGAERLRGGGHPGMGLGVHAHLQAGSAQQSHWTEATQERSSTDLLGNLLVGAERNPLVLGVANLPRHVIAHLERLLHALAVGHILAELLRQVDTVLVRNLLADGEGDLPLLGLGHVDTLLVRLIPAGAGDDHPHLAVALPLPAVLALLLVQRLALRLYEGLELRTHLLLANLQLTVQ